VAGALGADRPAVQLARESDGELADVDHLLDLTAGLGSDLADLEADEGGEVVLVLAEQFAEAAHQPAADRCRHGAPGLERLAGTGHRVVHLRRVLPADGEQRRSVDRRGHRAVPGERVEIDTAAAGGVLCLAPEVLGAGQGGHVVAPRFRRC
jgi:hypothetical protein